MDTRKLDALLYSDLDDQYRSLYDPLDPSKREFRVLFMQPGDFESEDEIHVSLTTTRLDSPTPFRAISYTCKAHRCRCFSS